MEAFSLLKYWRNSGTGGGGPDGNAPGTLPSSAGTTTSLRASSNSNTTIVTAVSSPHASESDDEDDHNDDGPFFDLEFAVPDDEGRNAPDRSKNEETETDDEGTDSGEEPEVGEDGRELNFTLSSGSSGDGTDRNMSVSPSDDLFFKGRLVPIEHSSTDLTGLETNTNKIHFPVSLVKSATKFRVMMLKLKKTKSNTNEENADGSRSNSMKINGEKLKLEKVEKESSKFFTVKFSVNEVPIVSSLFAKDDSAKNIASSKPHKHNVEESAALDENEKKFSKETVQRYLKKVKPLYVRVSKRYGEKLRFSGQLSVSGAAKEGVSPPHMNEKEIVPEVKEVTLNVNTSQKQGSLPAGLRVVCKHLGKSRSASSSAVAAAPPGAVASKRRDDSLLQQQDGIQSAILHCKRSFKASRDLASSNSMVERSVSAACSSEEDKERGMLATVQGEELDNYQEVEKLRFEKSKETFHFI